jgi:hypothetical protein
MSKATDALVPVATVLPVATVGLGSQAASAAVNDSGPPSLNVKPSREDTADRTAMKQVPGSNVRDVASSRRERCARSAC